MRGDTLYPLNTLKEIYPDVYVAEAKKYEGREILMETIIPMLNCKWNDVLHLSAVDPREVDAAVSALGHPLLARRFLRIDPLALEEKRAVVYLNRHATPRERLAPENWERYDPTTVETYATISQETLAYYRDSYASGKHPLLWHGIPHFLYAGNLSLKDHAIIKI